MKSSIASLLITLGILAFAAPAAAASVHRFALVAGANYGGPDRPALQYAVSDARHFARVLNELGGVSASDTIVLEQPDLAQLQNGFEQLQAWVKAAARAGRAGGGGRTEALVYYSGHADDKGLLLGEDRYSYRSLRDRLDELPADVRIAVLDACASGAITRLKGGKLTHPFLVDESSEMRGHAFLTSSSESEVAQESDRIGASYFTHYLISGLRGAADANGEGKVTLNEAYQFAFNETLGRTVDTKGGAQHPSYDINLSGTGDVVMTDLRRTSATLVLAESLVGRFFVTNAKQELVVELYKPYGRKVELGLEPGTYEVHVEREASALVARPRVDEGARVVLGPAQFSPTKPEPSRRRGGFKPPPFAVTGRNRIELSIGSWLVPGSLDTPSIAAGSDSFDLAVGILYTRFLREDLALTFGPRVLGSSSSVATPTGAFAGDVGVVSLPLCVRWNPMKGDLSTRSIKPFLTLGLGPVIGSSSGSGLSADGAFAGSRTRASIGGIVGAGVDVHLSRHFSLGFDGDYQWMADFSDPIGARDNYSGFQFGVKLGWLFGAGSRPHE
jgi:hypothetical protein